MLQCLGNETSIVDCKHEELGVHDCIHQEDVGVNCGFTGEIMTVFMFKLDHNLCEEISFSIFKISFLLYTGSVPFQMPPFLTM